MTTLLTVSETCTALKVSRRTVFRLMRAGQLRWVQIGARRRITAAELERFIAERQAAVS